MKRITTILTFLMLVCMGVGAVTSTKIVFSSEQIKLSGSNPATYYDTSGNVVNSGVWCNKFITNTSIPITFTGGNLTRFSSYSGGFNTNGNLTFTATVPGRYLIKSVSFKAKIIDGGSKQTYIESYTAGRVTLTSEYQTVTSASLDNNQVTFRFENGNDGSVPGECVVVFDDFTFTIEDPVGDAVATIQNNHRYRIFTKNNGSSEGDTKFYLKNDGYITTSPNQAGVFTFRATTTNQFVDAGYAWRISDVSGKYFTNGSQNSFGTNIVTTTSQNRDTYEGQVFFLENGKCAIRSTNGSGTGYGETHFWDVKDSNSDGTPEAGYCTTDNEKHYIWQLEDCSNIVVYGPGTARGTFYKNGETTARTSGWVAKWVPTGTPNVTLSTTANNINASNSNLAPGASGCTYTLAAATPNYRITGYTIIAKGASDAATAQTITPLGGSATSWAANTTETLTVSGLHTNTTTFTMGGPNNELVLSTFDIQTEATTPVTSLSSLSNSKSYYVTGLRGTLQYATADATAMSCAGAGADLTAVKHRIAFLKSANNNYYAYSVNTGKFLATGNTLSDTPTPVFIMATEDANYPWFISLTSDKSADNVLINGSSLVEFSSHNTLDDGDRWAIVESAAFDATEAMAAITAFETENVTVTYKLTFNDNVIAEKAVTQAVGSAAVSPWTTPDFCELSDCSPTTVNAETEEVDITLTWDGPFDWSDDFSSATWYYWKLHDKYVIYGDGSYYALKETKDNAVATAEKAMWAFVGNPIDGVKVINKAAGSGKYLFPNLSSYPTMSTSEHSWVLNENTYRSNGFSLSYNGSSYWINDNGGQGKLAYWNDAAAKNDHGSICELDPVVYYDLALAYIDQYASDRAIASGYFGVLESGKTSYKNQITTAFSKTPAALTATVYENVVKPGCSVMISLPATGYYRLKNVNESTYFLGYDGTADAGSSVCLRGMQDSNVSARTIIHMVKNVDLSGNVTYQMSLQGTNIDAVSTSTKRTPSATAASYKPEYIQPGQGSFTTTSANGTYLHCSSSQEHAIVGWNTGKDSPASKWIVEDVSSLDITMNDGGDDHTYATLYLPFGVTIDGESDVNAYIMTIVGEVASGTNIGKDIPANTGVILKGTDTSVTLTINDAATATTTGNDLEGTCVVKDARENVEGVYDLVLGKGTESNTLGFYLAPTGGKLAANKAYLPYTPGAGARVNGFAIQWDDEVTGIRTIDNGKQSVKNGAFYDLSGRRVENPQHGMYIVNGRVVVIK